MKFIDLITNNKNKLFKDKLNFKYPGGMGYLPHIDGHFYWRDNKNVRRAGWKVYSNSFINFVMALEKSNISNGCLYVSNKNNIKKLGNNWKDITYTNAFFIGLFQALAFIPGASRAGVTITGARFLGYNRTDSAIFSMFRLTLCSILR